MQYDKNLTKVHKIIPKSVTFISLNDYKSDRTIYPVMKNSGIYFDF